MDAVPGLLALIAVLVLSGCGALVVADRALAPLGAIGGATAPVGPMLRRTAVRAAVAVVTALVALGGTVLAGVLLSGIGPAVGYALPVVTIAAGLAGSALVPAVPAAWRPVTTASLEPRRPWRSAPTAGLVGCAALVALAVLLLVTAATLAPAVAAYRDAGLAGAAAALAALVAGAWLALRRIALEPALPEPQRQADRVARDVAGRLVLTLAACALLAFDALVGLQAGVWMWGIGALLPAPGPLLPVGAVLTVVGGVAGLGVLPSAAASVAAAVSLWRSAGAVPRVPAA